MKDFINKMDTLYQTLIKNNGNSDGLGDIIRGLLTVNIICEKNNLRHIILLDDHIMGDFIEYKSPEKSLFNHLKIHDTTGYIKDFQEGLKKILSLANSGEYKIYTNFSAKLAFTGKLDGYLGDNQRIFVKDLLKPNDIAKKRLSELKSNLPDKYQIIHFRFGDHNFNTTNENTIKKYSDLIIKEHKNLEDKESLPIILICDNNIIKKRLPEYIKTLDINPVHVGLNKNKDLILDTLCEFWIVSESLNIKSFSVYSWQSGFVRWVSYLYKIPIQSCRINE